MKAVLEGRVLAETGDIIKCQGYQYFPPGAVRREWLEKAVKTASDNACPHGIQFYDVVLDGKRHPRAAWSYESPRPELRAIAGRFGFWGDVEVT